MDLREWEDRQSHLVALQACLVVLLLASDPPVSRQACRSKALHLQGLADLLLGMQIGPLCIQPCSREIFTGSSHRRNEGESPLLGHRACRICYPREKEKRRDAIIVLLLYDVRLSASWVRLCCDIPMNVELLAHVLKIVSLIRTVKEEEKAYQHSQRSSPLAYPSL